MAQAGRTLARSPRKQCISAIPKTRDLTQHNYSSWIAAKKCCLECGVTETPQWRQGPTGPQTLCNACGVRYSRLIRRQKSGKRGQQGAQGAAHLEVEQQDASDTNTDTSSKDAVTLILELPRGSSEEPQHSEEAAVPYGVQPQLPALGLYNVQPQYNHFPVCAGLQAGQSDTGIMTASTNSSQHLRQGARAGQRSHQAKVLQHADMHACQPGTSPRSANSAAPHPMFAGAAAAAGAGLGNDQDCEAAMNLLSMAAGQRPLPGSRMAQQPARHGRCEHKHHGMLRVLGVPLAKPAAASRTTLPPPPQQQQQQQPECRQPAASADTLPAPTHPGVAPPTCAAAAPSGRRPACLASPQAGACPGVAPPTCTAVLQQLLPLLSSQQVSALQHVMPLLTPEQLRTLGELWQRFDCMRKELLQAQAASDAVAQVLAMRQEEARQAEDMARAAEAEALTAMVLNLLPHSCMGVAGAQSGHGHAAAPPRLSLFVSAQPTAEVPEAPEVKVEVKHQVQSFPCGLHPVASSSPGLLSGPNFEALPPVAVQCRGALLGHPGSSPRKGWLSPRKHQLTPKECSSPKRARFQ